MNSPTRLHAFVEEANDENVIRVGTGRTRGLGSVEIDARPTSREDIAHLQSGSPASMQYSKKRANDAHVANLSPFYFALTLYTPTILCDPFLRYYNTIDGKTLSKLLNHSTQHIHQHLSIGGSATHHRLERTMGNAAHKRLCDGDWLDFPVCLHP